MKYSRQMVFYLMLMVMTGSQCFLFRSGHLNIGSSVKEDYETGQTRYKKGEYPAAETLFRKVLEADGRAVFAKYWLGLALYQQNKISAARSQFIQIQNGLSNPFENILLLILMFGITLVVVAITTGVRKIPVQYAKRVVGRKVYGGQATHIPLRILTAGVMPIIFAQALMFIPSTLASFFPQGNGFGDWLQRVFAPTHVVYSLFFAFLIIIFTYFYTAIAFNPVDVADNMKKQGGFIPGVRPGKSTSDYIDHILTRVTLPASIFLALIAVFPTFLSGFFNVDYSLASFYGGTSLLIIVGVALDTLQQIESHLLMRHYDGFLKTGKLKGRDRRR